MSIRWPRVLTPTYLSQIIRTQKNPIKALHIFNEAKSRYPNYHHNGPVYATMISILGTSGRLTEMKDVIEQMREDSCECKDSVFVSVIKTYANAGQVDEAMSLYKTIPQFNCVNWTESFNTILQIMVNENRLEMAHSIFVESSCGWEVRSRIRALNLLMYALCQKSRSDLALQLFQEMDYQSCYPDRDSYAILMKGLCQDKRLHEATHLLYSMFWRISQKGNGEDIVVYRILLDALCDAGKLEEAVEILGKILRKGLKAPKGCYNRSDLGQILDDNDIESAKRVIHEALIKGSIPSMASYNAMAVDLYTEGKIDEADTVIMEMQDRGFRPTHSIFEAKVAALCKVCKVDEAIKVIEEDMVKVNCLPTARVYNTLLKNLCNVGNSMAVLKSLNKMSNKVGSAGDRDTYGILLEMLCGERRYLEASQLLEKMSIKSYWPCTNSYNSVIKGLCSLGRQYEAVMWLFDVPYAVALPGLHDAARSSRLSGLEEAPAAGLEGPAMQLEPISPSAFSEMTSLTQGSTASESVNSVGGLPTTPSSSASLLDPFSRSLGHDAGFGEATASSSRARGEASVRTDETADAGANSAAASLRSDRVLRQQRKNPMAARSGEEDALGLRLDPRP